MSNNDETIENVRNQRCGQFRRVCPPRGRFERLITHGILLFLSWSVPWAVVGEEGLPGGNIFSLIVLIDCCLVSGFLVSCVRIPKIPPLPTLLGMLICGFCLRNIPVINVATNIDPNWSSTLRSMALSVILIRAGLELDAKALKKMKGVCFRLTILPCVVETVTCMLSARLLLNFPWEWGILLGFVLGAVTPAIIVPSLLYLQQRGFGVKSGIPTLVIAASSFDDVFAITGFMVTLAIVFSKGGIGLVILRGVGEVVCGIGCGVMIGMILRYIPAPNQKTLDRDRFILVVGCGISVLLGSGRIGFPGAGAMASIVQALVASMTWADGKDRISKKVGYLWILFEPVLFGLIGAEVSLEQLSSQSIGLSFLVLFIGLVTRSITSFLSVSFAGFTNKEKLFVCFAWLPKATVQAAIGSVALDTARSSLSDESTTDLAMQVLTISVLSILVTAPIGAACIGISGPVLLSKSDSDTKKTDAENEMQVVPTIEEGSLLKSHQDGDDTPNTLLEMQTET